MKQIPTNPSDKGYFNISDLKLSKMDFISGDLVIRFNDTSDSGRIMEITLNHIVAFNDKTAGKPICLLRVDSDGSSFGLDVASRLQQPSLINFQVLYLFEDNAHTSFVFRGLAKEISVAYRML